FIYSYLGAVLGFSFVIELAKKLYKILHTFSVVFFRNAGGSPSPSSGNFIVPPERNFVLTCNKKTHFFVLG
ncbi:hypothetical protein, partial [Bacillus mobilis]|uniref:hypothetical protein n=1 Tax=Bacillus mobilis TaxID=2026190 RepID=UPI00366C5753